MRECSFIYHARKRAVHEDLLPLIQELERAVELRNALAAAATLRRLNNETIYSGSEVYDRLHAVEGKLGVVLFEGLEPSEFGQLVSENKHLYAFRVWEALEELADRVSAEALWEIKDHLGFPSANSCPRLHSTLAVADDETISIELIETIGRLATKEAIEGNSLSAHEKTMSAFRFVRWSPDDQGLRDCVRLLAARNDDRAQVACRRYLIDLPWGADRQATLALLDGMSARPTAENQVLFKEALAVHKQSAVLRTWLWAAIGEDNPDECLLGVIGDLVEADNDADRITFIEYLGSALSQIRSQGISYSPQTVAAAADSVDTTGWSRLTRGYYGTVLKTYLSVADATRVSGRLERGAIALARVWETVRLDHMGCLIPLALMIGVGWLVGYGLDKLLGKPTQAPWLPAGLFWAWIVWALINVRTHFSGHETVSSKVRAGIVYFALLLGAFLAAVVVRLM